MNRLQLRGATLLLSSIPIALGACTTVGGGGPPGPTRRPVEPQPVRVAGSAAPVDVHDERASGRITAHVIEIALGSIGTPYEWGGTNANGFDCSGLIQFAYGEVGIGLPRTSTAQLRAGFPVAPEAALLLPGDVLGFSGDGSGKTSHVGLYIGEDRFIHSSSSGVRISTLGNPYWQQRLIAARRMVE